MTFEEFARAQLPAVVALATVLTGQPATAEDLTQEVLIRAHARWDRIGGLDRPDLYVRKMVVNEFLSWRRRSWRLVPAGDTNLSMGTVPDHAAGLADTAGMLAEIAKLPARQCAVLVLRYYEDLSDAEIADLMGCAPGTVRAAASRALAALRVTMAPEQPGEPALTQHVQGHI
jgi:RNA polymerase sigma-70 factor (sigma-E family)